MPTPLKLDIGQLFVTIPLIQSFIADVQNKSLTDEGRTKVIAEFVKKALVSTEALVSQDLLDNAKFNAAVDSLIVLVTAGIDSYEKIKDLVESTK